MDDEAQSKKWFSFDPTIHAGHIMTAIFTAIGCAGIYFGIVNDVTSLKKTDQEHEKRMDKIEADEKEYRAETNQKFESLIHDNNQALGKLRDDMNGWFMALDQKLDRKADKR